MAEIIKPQILKICANAGTQLDWSVILEDGTDHHVEELFSTIALAGRIDQQANNDNDPKMWLEGFGRLRVENNVAYIDGY